MDYPKRTEILGFIEDRVDVQSFFRHFKGDFQGKFYDSDFPPRAVFPNSSTCFAFADFITSTIVERIRSGPISIWGRVGEVDPPYLVMPLTVEPSKPRLCHDERFLNLWIVDLPFKLDHLSDLPR